MKSDVIDLDVQVLHQTEKAALVTLDVPENGLWLPLSQIELSETGIAGIMTVTLPEWLAQERGLI